jgi:hypothetical protein
MMMSLMDKELQMTKYYALTVDMCGDGAEPHSVSTSQLPLMDAAQEIVNEFCKDCDVPTENLQWVKCGEGFTAESDSEMVFTITRVYYR